MNKVLLIEDNETSNFISRIILKSAGIEFVDEVLNGMEAFNYIDKECHDLIFLDIDMPVMDGWEFLDEKKYYAPWQEGEDCYSYIFNTS